MEDLGALVADHQGPLFAYLYRLCGNAAPAEEFMQETFVRALQASRMYTPQGRISTWLFSIATNLVRDDWRRRARRGEPLALHDLSLAAPDSTEEAALHAIRVADVRQALLHLPLEQRSVLVLRFYHDLSYDEIAHVVACPVGTVRSRIHNGVQRLRRRLNEEAVTK